MTDINKEHHKSNGSPKGYLRRYKQRNLAKRQQQKAQQKAQKAMIQPKASCIQTKVRMMEYNHQKVRVTTKQPDKRHRKRWFTKRLLASTIDNSKKRKIDGV